MNSELNHITVLEEAHNLLRRTSTQQSTEGANLLGKSVEMIANAIAEMRTYGEGFIIADQAPGLMDMSVIRNTNTKIIMRLPDQSDRELVGRAADLNDDQIKELAKLPCGVGAVYQNEWVQPVLCKIDEVDTKNAEYRFDPTSNDSLLNQNDEVKYSLLNCIMDKELFSIGDKQDLKELKNIVLKSGLSSLVKADLFNYIESEKEEGMLALQRLIYDFLDAEKAISESVEHSEIHEWVDAVLDKLEPSVKGYTKKQIDIAVMLILCEQMVRDPSYKNVLNKFIETYRNGGGVF
jgi:DNA helicase HerA-like ATPase